VTSTQRILREKRRILVPLALFAIANVVLFMVVIFPLQRQVASAEIEARNQHQHLNAARFDLKNAKATVTGKATADSALQKFYKDVLPVSQSVARNLTYTRLAQLARQANVKLEHGTNGIAREKGSALSKLTTTYTLSGDYRDVRKFIYSLETAPEFIVLENVILSSPGDEAQGRGLAMNLDIATYFRSENDGQ
jgi:type IV pilus assembly protein PilO